MLIARIFKRAAGLQIKPSLNFFVGFFYTAFAEHRILFDFEQACGYVFGRQRKHFFQRVSKRFFRLGRYRKHQVKADISHAALPQSFKRLFADIGTPPPSEQSKFAVAKRLNAHADASDAVSDKRTDKFLCHIFGIHFNSYFRAVFDFEMRIYRAENAAELLRCQNGRCAAADIYGADRTAEIGTFYLIHKRTNIILALFFGAYLRIKIAICAL